MENLLDLYRNNCSYEIKDCIQQLDLDINIDILKSDMLKFISTNKFGFNAVSLRLPKGESNYVDSNEALESTGYGAFNYATIATAENTRPNSDYTEWHPLLQGTYVTRLVPELEKLTGLKIGRIRLGWLQPNAGYAMHIDLEPMRIHIPIITNNYAFFIQDNKLQRMEYGKLYHLITTNIHTAHNFGFLPRLHLIFSTYGNETIESEINKLSTQSAAEDNFLNHIPQGIDNATLSYLLKFYMDQRNDISVSDNAYSIQTLRNLLDKKNN